MEEEFLVSSRRLKTLQKTRQQEAWLSRRLYTGQEESEREKRRWQRWLEGCRRKNGGGQELLSSSSVAVAPTEKRRQQDGEGRELLGYCRRRCVAPVEAVKIAGKTAALAASASPESCCLIAGDQEGGRWGWNCREKTVVGIRSSGEYCTTGSAVARRNSLFTVGEKGDRRRLAWSELEWMEALERR